MKGLTQIPNTIFDSPIWKNPEWLRAYCDIMRRVWWEDSKDGRTLKGEVMVTLRKSAMRWGWDKNKVSRFLAYLIENNWLKCTDKTSIFTIRDTKSDTLWDENRDTKKPKRQRVNKKDRDTFGDTKRDTKRDTTPYIGEYTNKGEKNIKENARATASSETPPPALPTETATDGTPLPFGVKRADWDKFAKWSEINLPTLRPRITPVVYWKLRTMSLNDTKQMATILVEMEQGGRKIHVIENEYGRRLREWEENCR